jgi:hypothetical protein
MITSEERTTMGEGTDWATTLTKWMLGERHQKQSFLRFITNEGSGHEAAEVDEENPKAGEQRLPVHGDEEKGDVFTRSSGRTLLKSERSRSEGECLGLWKAVGATSRVDWRLRRHAGGQG